MDAKHQRGYELGTTEDESVPEDSKTRGDQVLLSSRERISKVQGQMFSDIF